jgi:enterochelin esterase-like enzyme
MGLLHPVRSRFVLALALVALAAPPLAGSAATGAQQTRLRFAARLAPEVSDRPVSGRLIVFMKPDSGPSSEMLEPGYFDPESVWLAAMEVRNLAPGASVELDPDGVRAPRKLSLAPKGDYRIMALLDPDHTYAYHGADDGDLYSEIVRMAALDPAAAAPVEIALTKRKTVDPPRDTELVKLASMRGEALTAFWGRPVEVRAGVVLPPGYASSPGRGRPAVYVVHGFGGSHRDAWVLGDDLARKMGSGEMPEMIWVFLDGSCPMGHHEFADSVNNGPWGRALTSEFIPYLERKFRMDGRPPGRFLTGHSSGGWSTLWLQITYPDFFGGTWSTAPDPVDFRNFTLIDLTKAPAENFYRRADGSTRNLVRVRGRELATMEQYVAIERVTGDYGGQLASFEAVFSPRGEDGRPMPVFDRDTGAIDPTVAKAWERYDIAFVPRRNWARLGPKLRGKLHIIVGSEDTFHLEEAVYLLRDALRELGSDAVFEVVPGRDHMDLYQGGLSERIAREMYARARPSRGRAARAARPL